MGENPYYGSVVRSMPTAGMRTQAGSQGQRSSGGSEMAPPQEPSVASGEPKDAELKRNNGGSQGAASHEDPLKHQQVVEDLRAIIVKRSRVNQFQRTTKKKATSKWNRRKRQVT